MLYALLYNQFDVQEYWCLPTKQGFRARTAQHHARFALEDPRRRGPFPEDNVVLDMQRQCILKALTQINHSWRVRSSPSMRSASSAANLIRHRN
jgi:hypothetical protein